MYLVWDKNFYGFYNDAYVPLLGRKEKYALGMPFAELWSEMWQTVGPIAEGAMAGKTSYFDDLPLTLHRHGYPEETFFSFSYSPVRDSYGVVQGVLCTVFETTEKVLSLARLKESEARLAISLEASGNIGTWTVDPETLATTVDVRFARLFQVDTADAGSGNLPLVAFTERIHSEDRPRVLLAIERAMRDGMAYEEEYRLPQPGGLDIWVSAKGGMFTDAETGKRRFAGVAVDITARKAVEEQLRNLNQTLEQKVEERTKELLLTEESLRQAQKMEAIGKLTGGIAHDFNNLLQGIQGNLEMIQIQLATGNTASLGRYIDAALKASERSGALTHRLLAFARRQTLVPKPVNVNELIESMADLIQSTVGSGIQLRLALEEGIWPVLTDANQMENALLNLVVNARDALPSGGYITLSTRNLAQDPAASGHVTALALEDQVMLTVEDNGTGMAPDVLKQAIEPFYTTKPLGEGTGLGLSMVDGFVNQSRGNLIIESTPGKGTRVKLYFPRHWAPAEPRTTEVTAATTPAVTHRKTVMIVDDEPTVREMLVTMLEELGYETISAADGHQALSRVEQAGDIALLVSDIGLPGGMNGRQLAGIVREKRPAIPVLFITGYAEQAVIRDELPKGMHVLVKPFNLKAFAEAVRTYAG